MSFRCWGVNRIVFITPSHHPHGSEHQGAPPLSPSAIVGNSGPARLYFPPDTQARVAAPGGRPAGRWFGPGNGPDGAPPGPPSSPADGASGDSDAAGPGSGDPRSPSESGGGDQPPGSEPISSNPAAVDIITGTGALGRLLGLDRDSGIRLGGLWIGDASGVLAGGRRPGKWGLNSLAIADLNLDMEKLSNWSGASFGTQFLQFSGEPTNVLAGAFPGFDSIEVTPPLTRQQLYQLWYRQALFDNKLIFRVGK